MTLPADQRRRDLAQIHIAKAQLGMDDATYRDMLWTRARVRTSKELDHAGRAAVLDHLKACGWVPSSGARRGSKHEWAWVDKAAPDRQPMLKKVIMQLKAAGRGKAYADGVASRMFGVEKLEFCGTHQLHKIVTALNKDAARRAA